MIFLHPVKVGQGVCILCDETCLDSDSVYITENTQFLTGSQYLNSFKLFYASSVQPECIVKSLKCNCAVEKLF